MSRWRVGCLAIVAVLVLLPAVPARAATAAVSCVDLDNDGTCGINEPALGPILDANGGFLDTEFASPGFVPPGGSVGVVLNNFATNNDSLAIYATGDIRINGKLKAKHVESVDLETIQDMFVGPSASIAFSGGRCCLSDITLIARNLAFGAKAQMKAGGEDSSWFVEAKNIDFGDGTKVTASGDGAFVSMQADNRLSFGLNDQFKTPNSGGISLYSFQSISATGLKVIGGDIDIESFPPEDGHIPGREITLTDSLINQTSVDGSLTMLAGDTFEPKDSDRITFIHTRVIARGGFADIEPEPVIF